MNATHVWMLFAAAAAYYWITTTGNSLLHRQQFVLAELGAWNHHQQEHRYERAPALGRQNPHPEVWSSSDVVMGRQKEERSVTSSADAPDGSDQGNLLDEEAGVSVIAHAGNVAVVLIDSSSAGRDGTAGGRVRFYEHQQQARSLYVWKQRGGDFDAMDWNDDSKPALALSRDGFMLAIGLPTSGEWDKGLGIGLVRAYRWDALQESWIRIGNDLYGSFWQQDGPWSASWHGDNRIHLAAVPCSVEACLDLPAREFVWDETSRQWRRHAVPAVRAGPPIIRC